MKPNKGLATVLSVATIAFISISTSASAQVSQKQYAKVRGWDVRVIFEGKNFGGCVGINPDNGGAMRIALTRDYNWGVSMRARGDGFTNGNLEIDGRNSAVQYQYSPEGWVNVGLTAQELGELQSGRSVGINIGNGYFDFSLAGSSAAIGKITECVNRKGSKPQRRVAQQKLRPKPAQTSGQQPKQAKNNQCRRGEQFLPISGLCTDKARRLLVIANGVNDLDTQSMAPGCSVAVNETEWFGDVLLYKAERCNGVTTKYKSERGPHRGISGVLTGDAYPRATSVFLTTIGGKSDAKTNIEYRAREEMKSGDGDKNKCFAFPGEGFGHPKGSFVFNDRDSRATDAFCAKEDGPCGIGFCGKFGYFGDAKGYWRVFGSHAWYFDFGQDGANVEVRTMTLITKDGGGGWKVGSQFD